MAHLEASWETGDNGGVDKREQAMTKVLVLPGSTYGHVAMMAQAVAKSAGAAGAAIETWSTGGRRRRAS